MDVKQWVVWLTANLPAYAGSIFCYVIPSESTDEYFLSVIGAGESVHFCHVQLQREKGRACGAPPTGWLHCGLH